VRDSDRTPQAPRRGGCLITSAIILRSTKSPASSRRWAFLRLAS
jgi:hypothetical protein